MKKFINFLKESREELSKVVWPTRKQTIEMTIVVVIVVLIFGVYLGGVDYILSELMGFLLN